MEDDDQQVVPLNKTNSNHHHRHQYALPVDEDGKATEFKPFSLSSPHMRAFHLAWLSLFSCFFSTFSIPPLLPLIRRDLHLTQTHLSRAAVAAFLGSIFSRIAMGPICDVLGPHLASASLSLLTSPVILAASLVSSPAAFIAVRFLVGFSLANFVASQFWMSCMFSRRVIGLASGVSAGWASMGSGATQLIMPQIYTLLVSSLSIESSRAWRLSFILPAVLHASTAVLVLTYGQDLPSDSYKRRYDACSFQNDSEKDLPSGSYKRRYDACSSQKDSEKLDSFSEVFVNGVKNYRGWILALIYGFCFGVELTTDNIVAQYFYDRFGVNIQVAGTIASCFGLANFFSRPSGGLVSDLLGRRFGMRGGLWATQTVAGLLCVVLGRVDSLSRSIVVMCVFSVFVQASSGLTFGVVPFVSKRSLGVISGITGSGGTMGAVITQFLLFSGTKYSQQTGISLMGIMMILCTLPVTLIYFPQWGGMFCSPSDHKCDRDPEADDHYRVLE